MRGELVRNWFQPWEIDFWIWKPANSSRRVEILRQYQRPSNASWNPVRARP